MANEITVLWQNKTFTLAPLSLERKVVKCKWVFKIKYNFDEMIDKYKVRLIVWEDMQKTDLNFKKTYAPVARMNSTRLLFTITMQLNLFTLHINISNTYLYEEWIDIYMTQPLEFINIWHSNYVCLLNKSLYSIKWVGRICMQQFENIFWK
jgi:Reverse transcriptase (RNA-dependent DNA polymerase)